ncbi:MAG: SIMPL domain-containing protein [Chloroflexota bacterium]
MKNKLHLTPIVLSLALAAVLLISAVSPELTLQDEPEGDSPQRTINVSGNGQVSAPPDITVVRLGVQTEAEEAATALEENNDQMQALIGVLEDADIPAEDIQTQVVQLFPRYEETPTVDGQPELVGYTATNVVEVRVRDIDAVGGILDEAVQAGGNRIEGIRFEISDPAEYLDQAREAAWNDAQNKAEQLAGLAGTELGEVLTINESGRVPQPIVERPAIAEVAAAVPIEPGSQTVQVDLQVTWLLGAGE